MPNFQFSIYREPAGAILGGGYVDPRGEHCAPLTGKDGHELAAAIVDFQRLERCHGIAVNIHKLQLGFLFGSYLLHGTRSIQGLADQRQNHTFHHLITGIVGVNAILGI